MRRGALSLAPNTSNPIGVKQRSRQVAPALVGGCTNLSRRLERLEEATAPAGEAKVWQIVTIDSAGFRPSPGGRKSRGR
jgi:hypothetical protein